MKRIIVLLFLSVGIVSCITNSQPENDDVLNSKEKEEIIAIMNEQEKAWSNHDIEGFMQGYWKSDSLKFYGSNGVTYGWNKTLANYKRGYPTKEHTGTLKFKINDISKITKGAYFVMGEYHLTRTVGNADGVFMIIFKKINGEWKIIADTSC